MRGGVGVGNDDELAGSAAFVKGGLGGVGETRDGLAAVIGLETVDEEEKGK